MTMAVHTPCELLAQTMSRLFVCSAQGEFTKIMTPYLYPDGDCIYLFVKKNNTGPGGTIADLGETTRWLRGQTLSPKRTPRQSAMIADICETLRVEFFKGALLARYQNDADFIDAATRVSQAAIRVSDLWLSFRNRALETVTGEVEEYLTEERIPFEKTPQLVGRSGKIWTPHLKTRTEARTSLVYVLSTGSRSAARGVTEHVVTAWYDLANQKAGRDSTEFVSLFDDTADVWGPEDFNLVASLSRVALWSEPEEFARILRAAA